MIKKYLKVPQIGYFASISTVQRPIILPQTMKKEVPIFLYEKKEDFAEELFNFFIENNPREVIFYDITKNRDIGIIIDEYDKIILKEYYIELFPKGLTCFGENPTKVFYSQMANIYCITDGEHIRF